jgi:HEAT repeat protein
VATDVDAAIAGPALLALGRSTDITALDALRVALANTEPARRVAALAALGQRRDPSTVPTIVAIAAADADRSVRDRALATLVEISDRDAVAGLIGLTAIPRRRPAAIAALARLGAPDVDALVAGLAHPDIDVRLSVIEALGRMRQGAGTAALTRALRDPSSFVQAAAAHALASVELHREG